MLPKVLLVDDEQEFLEIVSERLAVREMDVTTATSAQQAFDIMQHTSFDAIVMDFQMPGIDGLEALAAIKARNPGTRIILMTGYATIEKRNEAMRMGAADLVEKPADLEALTAMIKAGKAG
jgi:DNA-binding NtrC family response regulator